MTKEMTSSSGDIDESSGSVNSKASRKRKASTTPPVTSNPPSLEEPYESDYSEYNEGDEEDIGSNGEMEGEDIDDEDDDPQYQQQHKVNKGTNKSCRTGTRYSHKLPSCPLPYTAWAMCPSNDYMTLKVKGDDNDEQFVTVEYPTQEDIDSAKEASEETEDTTESKSKK